MRLVRRREQRKHKPRDTPHPKATCAPLHLKDESYKSRGLAPATEHYRSPGRRGAKNRVQGRRSPAASLPSPFLLPLTQNCRPCSKSLNLDALWVMSNGVSEQQVRSVLPRLALAQEEASPPAQSSFCAAHCLHLLGRHLGGRQGKFNGVCGLTSTSAGWVPVGQG